MVWLYQQTGTLTFANVPTTLGWYTLAFTAYLVVLMAVEWQGGLSLKLIFAGAILFRGLLLFTSPTLSGDVHRYVWEGYLATQGVSPYAYPVDSLHLDELHIPARDRVDHAWMASPYLPAVQGLFAVIAWLFPEDSFYYQLTLVIIDLLNGWLLVKLLQQVRLPAYRSRSAHRCLDDLLNLTGLVVDARAANAPDWGVAWPSDAGSSNLNQRLARFCGCHFFLAMALVAIADLRRGDSSPDCANWSAGGVGLEWPFRWHGIIWGVTHFRRSLELQ
jgi:hypothetical protein